jgi:ribosomal protein S6
MKKNIYQIVLVLAPKTAEKDRETLFAKLEEMVVAAGAKVEAKESLGVKELVYDIKKNSKGEFWSWKVESGKSFGIKEINLFLNRQTSIIRYLILKE